MNTTATIATGRTVYVASEMRYYGKATIESIVDSETLVVKMANGKRGKVNIDQVFNKAAEAKANATDHIIWNR